MNRGLGSTRPQSTRNGITKLQHMDDISKQFKDFQQKVETSLKRFPRLAASVAQNFFLNSFRAQAWFGEYTEVWAKLKDKKEANRNILVKRATLKRSVRIKKADWNSIIIGSDLPYAAVHNEGYRGVYTRTASRKVKIRGGYQKYGDQRKRGRSMTIQGVTHKVRQNIPRRRYMGNSPYVNAQLDREFTNELLKIK